MSFAVSRFVLLAVTVTAAAVRHGAPAALWKQWDARWYIGIAHYGYHFTIHGKSALAFFPLFPLLIRILMVAGIVGVAAGILLSNGAFLGALFYLHALIQRERGPDIAARAVWLLALFPTAFFTFAPYTESIFLLAAVGSIYHARRGEPARAGLWSAMAILSRSTGLILIPAVLLALRDRGQRASVLATIPVLVASAVYAAYLAAQNIPLAALLTAQSGWHRSLTFPWTGFTASISWLIESGISHLPWTVENLLQLAVTCLFLLLTVMAWKDLLPAERAYCAGFWALVLLSPQWMNRYYAPFSSMDRFVLALFPLAGWAAGRLSARSWRPTLLAFAALMAGSAGVFLAGGWVG